MLGKTCVSLSWWRIPVRYLHLLLSRITLCDSPTVYVLTLLWTSSWVPRCGGEQVSGLSSNCLWCTHTQDFLQGKFSRWNCWSVRVGRCLPSVNLEYKIASYFTGRMTLFGNISRIVIRDIQSAEPQASLGTLEWSVLCRGEEEVGRGCFEGYFIEGA